MIKADLHLHTNHSDGEHHPFEVLRRAKAADLDIISITDHDCVDAIEIAQDFTKELNITLISGIEISTDIDDKEIHLLGYFIDHTNKELLKYLDYFRDERLNRAIQIIKKLNDIGFEISLDDVLKRTKSNVIGRPHIAFTLAELGYVKNIWEAFEKYLYDDGPAYQKKIHVSPKSALSIIKEAGGLSSIAHPCDINEEILKQLIELGLDGIEVIHPSHTPEQIKLYKSIANEYYLLQTGGSDFHGGKKYDDSNLGKHWISEKYVSEMKQRL